MCPYLSFPGAPALLVLAPVLGGGAVLCAVAALLAAAGSAGQGVGRLAGGALAALVLLLGRALQAGHGGRGGHLLVLVRAPLGRPDQTNTHGSHFRLHPRAT